MLHTGNVGISAMPHDVAADGVNATSITYLVGDELYMSLFYGQYTALTTLIIRGNVLHEKG